MKLSPHVWERYSKKLKERVLSLQYVGSFTDKEAKEKGIRWAVGKEGSLKDGNLVVIYLLVDPEDGIILDASFQAFGHSALLAAADVACALVMRKTYQMAGSLSSDTIDQALRDKPNIAAFPLETFSHLNLVLFALDEAISSCLDIPIAEEPPTTPFSFDETEAKLHPNWENLTKKEKLTIIEKLLDDEIRPYIALDGGGVHIKEFREEKELIITYEGACTTCFASTGSTLTAIQQLLKGKLHPSLTVITDESVLTSTLQLF